TPFTSPGERAAFDRALAAAAKEHNLPVPSLNKALSDMIDSLSDAFIRQAVGVASVMGTQLDKLSKKFKDDHWNALASSVDIGIVSRSATGHWSDLQGKKFGGLVSIAFPLGASNQIIAQGQGRHRIGGTSSETSYVGSGARWLVGN